jgi:uncharacterized membrane protein
MMMVPFFVLISGLFLFRSLGALGVQFFVSWRASARFALAAMFVLTASAHFNGMKDDLVRMMPPGVPYPEQVVFVTGILEILGAVGLLLPFTYRAAGIALSLFLIAVFPANVYAAMHGVTIQGQTATPIGIRFLIQLVFLGTVWWSTQTAERDRRVVVAGISGS